MLAAYLIESTFFQIKKFSSAMRKFMEKCVVDINDSHDEKNWII